MARWLETGRRLAGNAPAISPCCGFFIAPNRTRYGPILQCRPVESNHYLLVFSDRVAGGKSFIDRRLRHWCRPVYRTIYPSANLALTVACLLRVQICTVEKRPKRGLLPSRGRRKDDTVDAQRTEALADVVRGLSELRRAGVVYLSPDGEGPGSAYSWPWPEPGEEKERRERLAAITEVLERLTGRWMLWLVPEGQPIRRGYRVPWPERQGLWPEVDREEEAAKSAVLSGSSANAGRGAAVTDAQRPPVLRIVMTGGETGEVTPTICEQEAPAVVLPQRTHGELAAMMESARERPHGYSARCAENVVQLLRERKVRLTLSQIADAFSARGVPFGSSAIDHTVPYMRKAGVVDNARDARGAGYGLVEWLDGKEIEPE